MKRVVVLKFRYLASWNVAVIFRKDILQTLTKAMERDGLCIICECSCESDIG